MTAKYTVRDGESRDAAYRRIAGELELFGVAFFGHGLKNARDSRNARRRLTYAWKAILRQLPPPTS